MLFLSDLSRQESHKYTTSQQDFDAPESRNGDESPDVSDTSEIVLDT